MFFPAGILVDGLSWITFFWSTSFSFGLERQKFDHDILNWYDLDMF